MYLYLVICLSVTTNECIYSWNVLISEEFKIMMPFEMNEMK